MSAFPPGAFFPSPPQASNAGVDFLALGAVGERLIAHSLPGITNVTRYLRPYSVASWITWKFDAELKKLSGQRLPMNERALFKQFREKSELMFSWANKGTAGSIGSRRTYPEDAKPVELRFGNSALGAENNASWFAAAAYRPSFSDTGGLGFIAAHKGVYVPTDLGREMAKHLDAVLLAHKTSYSRLSDLNELELSRRDVDALMDGLALELPTTAERKLFKRILYPEHLVGQIDGLHGNRATSMTLMIRSIDAAEALNEQEIRQTMALGLTPSGTPVLLDNVISVHKVWFVLAIRQLQRVSLERLLRWFELTVAENDMSWCDLGVVQNAAVTQLITENPDARVTSVGDHIAKIQSAITRGGGPKQVMLKEPSLNAFVLRDEFEIQTRTDHLSIPARAVYCLLYCAALTSLVCDDEEIAALCRMGGRERIGLDWFAKYVFDRQSQSLTEFIRDAIRDLIYGQHLQVAATRIEEGKNKFRFAVDDSGLRLLIGPESINRQLGTPDRIFSALCLMADCGITTLQPNGKFCIS